MPAGRPARRGLALTRSVGDDDHALLGTADERDLPVRAVGGIKVR